MSEELSNVATGMGYEIVHWTLDTNDWQYDYSYTPVLNTIQAAETGHRQSKIVLMHDRPLTVKALSSIIKYYKDLGYKFVNMEQCLGGGLSIKVRGKKDKIGFPGNRKGSENKSPKKSEGKGRKNPKKKSGNKTESKADKSDDRDKYNFDNWW